MFEKFISFIVSAIAGFLTGIIDKLPSIDFQIPDGVLDGLTYITNYISYFIPIKALMPILIIDVGLCVFQIVWAIILRIKSFIPTMGA